ncbi:DNA-processing protein DprA [Leifsonia sp. 2MCAF36]|uniref:DNA-processing protein DprA n=1 Tax=Leifsonia sp. 2MCAF36 TaxID=3232988 RepID=UPI003F9B802E
MDDGSLGTTDIGDAVLEECFARAALGTAIEPGDLEAGRLIAAIGPVGLLRALVEGAEASSVLASIGSDDGKPDEGTSEEGRQVSRAETAGNGLRPPYLAAADGERSVRDGPEPQDDAGMDSRLERRIADALARWRPRLSLAESTRTLERAARIGARLLTPESDWWPEGFAALDEGAPLALWIRGDARHFERLGRSVALVGARASTGYGEHVAMESAAALSDRGFAIVSGGAYGIDAAAHRATLASGGLTVAFLAGGADRLYPAGNSELLRRVATEGLLAAELPPGSAPTRWRFLMRNRLIAAAASATVVVEAGRRSGSLNTAGHAAQMGRPLGAVPGSVLSPASAGCHRLIREYAATCVTTADEMAELADPFGLGGAPDPAAPQAGASDGSSSEERTVVSELSRGRSASADEIAARAALPFSTVAAVLGRLDLAGRARESGGGWSLIERKCL